MTGRQSFQLFKNSPWEVKASSNVDLYSNSQVGNYKPNKTEKIETVDVAGGVGPGAWALANVLNQDIFKAYIPWFLYKPPFGYPRAVNPLQLRLFAENPYVFSVVKAIQDEVANTPYDIKVKEEWAKQGLEYDNMDRLQILKFFDQPNGNNFETSKSIFKCWIKDLCEIGEAIGVKVFRKNGTFNQLLARDAGTFLLNSDMFGMIQNRAEFVKMPNQDLMLGDLPNDYVEEYSKKLKENGNSTSASLSVGDKINEDMKKGPYYYMYSEAAAYFQYGWTPGSRPVPFGKREVVRILMNPRTNSIYSQSPIEVLFNTILTLVYGGEYNLDFYLNNNLPNGLLVFKGVDPTTAETYRAQLSDHMMAPDEFGNVKKKHFKVPITGYEANFIPMQMSSKEMEVIEQQKWFLKTLYACYDEDTEILTEEGWKLFKDLKDEKVARVNPKSFSVDYVKPEAYQKYSYKGRLIDFNNRNISLRVTPEHKCLWTNRYKLEKSEFMEDRADKLFKEKEVLIPTAFNIQGIKIEKKKFKNITMSGVQFSKFMGFWLGDGWVEKANKSIQFAVSKVIYPDVYEEFTDLLKEIGFKWKEYDVKVRKTENKVTKIRLANTELYEYLKQFGKSHDKFIPREIKNSTKEEIDSFLYFYMLSDGCESENRNIRYFSVSKKLADDVQYLYIRTGRSANINEWNNGYEVVARHSKTNLRNEKTYTQIYPESKTQINYDGFVYDVTVPEHHFLVIRRNGRVCISGNCFGLNENEMGFVENVNRANGETQERAVIRKLTKPFLSLIEDALNNQLMPEFGHPEFEFKFIDYNIDDDIKKHQLYESQIRMGIKTSDMVAEELGIDTARLRSSKAESQKELYQNTGSNQDQTEKKSLEKSLRGKGISEDIIAKTMNTFELVNNNKDSEMLRSSITSEFSAISLYEDMASKTKDKELKKVLLDIAREEKVHVGEFQRMLEKLDKQQPSATKEGYKEVGKIIQEKSEIETKPFAGFSDFDSCVAHMKKKGHDDESAHKICGKLQSEHEK